MKLPLSKIFKVKKLIAGSSTYIMYKEMLTNGHYEYCIPSYIYFINQRKTSHHIQRFMKEASEMGTFFSLLFFLMDQVELRSAMQKTQSSPNFFT